MSLERKLAAWRAAGLIDAATADAIAAHEAAAARPVALWAAAGLGLLALALGAVLTVAANWDRIPDAVKLGVHLAAMLGAAAAAWRGLRDGRLWLGEGALFGLGALTLAGIALHAQIYQQTGPLWEALAVCAVLMAPALLLAGRTRLTALALAGLLAVLAISYGDGAGPRSGLLADNLRLALPPALVALSLLLTDPDREPFARELRHAGLALILGGASLAHLLWAQAWTADEVRGALVRLPLAAAVTLWAAHRAGRLGGADGAVLRTVLLAGLAAVAVTLAVPHGDNPAARFAGVLSYFALWGLIARAAAAHRWRALFGLAVAALALRLFIVYLELFYDLASTGLGLILGGLLLLGLAAGWRRIMARGAR
ncbi:MAG: DUF2157 domain-containing protein [Alphaproteobacteria bacterium]|nr:DUF2157 domain-containing protein [Alphaproteobacteria bacterium]